MLLVAFLLVSISWLSGRAQAVSPSKRIFCSISSTEHGVDRVHATTTTTLVPPSPVINKFSPLFGDVGTVVHVRGRFLCNATVTINGTPAEIFENTGRRIGVTVPSGASTGPIRVTTPEGTIASTGSYTVTVRPNGATKVGTQ
jgi:hypothetical protein